MYGLVLVQLVAAVLAYGCAPMGSSPPDSGSSTEMSTSGSGSSTGSWSSPSAWTPPAVTEAVSGEQVTDVFAATVNAEEADNAAKACKQAAGIPLEGAEVCRFLARTAEQCKAKAWKECRILFGKIGDQVFVQATDAEQPQAECPRAQPLCRGILVDHSVYDVVRESVDIAAEQSEPSATSPTPSATASPPPTKSPTPTDTTQPSPTASPTQSSESPAEESSSGSTGTADPDPPVATP